MNEAVLKPCGRCSSDCRIEIFPANEHLSSETSIWICSASSAFGGACHGSLGYLSAEDWNAQPSTSSRSRDLERQRIRVEAFNDLAACFDRGGQHEAAVGARNAAAMGLVSAGVRTWDQIREAQSTEWPADPPLNEWADCPFDKRLPRIPYLVLPKLALQVMPMEWRHRFDAMLDEMDDAGIKTPNYIVLRDDGARERYTRATVVNEETGFIRIMGGEDDPWADYRHMKFEKVAALCPDFKVPRQ